MTTKRKQKLVPVEYNAYSTTNSDHHSKHWYHIS